MSTQKKQERSNGPGSLPDRSPLAWLVCPACQAELAPLPMQNPDRLLCGCCQHVYAYRGGIASLRVATAHATGETL